MNKTNTTTWYLVRRILYQYWRHSEEFLGASLHGPTSCLPNVWSNIVLSWKLRSGSGLQDCNDSISVSQFHFINKMITPNCEGQKLFILWSKFSPGRFLSLCKVWNSLEYHRKCGEFINFIKVKKQFLVKSNFGVSWKINRLR